MTENAFEVLGFDPGAHTGMAVVSAGKLVVCQTIPWGDDGLAVTEELRRQIEVGSNAWTRAGLFAVVEMPGPGFWKREGYSSAAQCKIAMDVGSCRAKANALVGALQVMGIPVTKRAPLRGGTKKTITGQMFRAMFPEWIERLPSNHGRDAAVLAEGEFRRIRMARLVVGRLPR